MPRARKSPKSEQQAAVDDQRRRRRPRRPGRPRSRAALAASGAQPVLARLQLREPVRIVSIRTTPSRVATGERATSGLTRAIAISGSAVLADVVADQRRELADRR